MNEGLLGSRIREYDPANILEQENVLRELLHFDCVFNDCITSHVIG